LRDLTGPLSIAAVQARLRQQLVESLGYADHMTLTGGLELT
jgi:lipoyl(octanoyl) transferase